MNDVILASRGLIRTFDDGELNVDVLKGIDLDVYKGESLAIVGSSGSGKSTLLHCLGGLDEPTAGTVVLSGRDIFNVKPDERDRLRNRSLGFVYQFHHLLQELTALENVALPLLIRGVEKEDAAREALEWLAAVELENRAKHKPAQLSGGERQRIAMARALVGKPECVLADEPTGNLDNENAQRIYELMLTLTREKGTAFVVVTHDFSLAESMDRTLQLRDGALAHLE